MASHGAGGRHLGVSDSQLDVGQKCLKRTNEISTTVIYGRKKSGSAGRAGVTVPGADADRDSN